MPYDANGDWYGVTVTEKGTGRKSKGKNTAPSSKTVARPKDTKDKKELPSIEGVVPASTLPTETVTERNNRNRGFGRGVENNVAKLTGGHKVPASGAIKTSVWGLLGDVHIKYENGHEVLSLVECKGTSGINPSGDKTFTLKKSVLDQCMSEADQLHAIGAVWVHWKNANYTTDDYVIIHSRHFLDLIERVKATGLELR